MRLKSTIVALLLGLSLISLACSKSGGSAGSLSDDDKHKLFQAAAMSGDPQLAVEASQKLGLIDSGGKPTADFEKFSKDHIDWGAKNTAWVQEYADKAKAKEYAKSHMP